MKILTFFICVFFSSSLIADTYAVCKAEDKIYSLKFTNNKIFINQNNTGYKDWSDYIVKFSKEEVVLKKEYAKKPLKLSENCNYEDFIYVNTFSLEVKENLVFNCPTTKVKPLDMLLQSPYYIERVQNAYNEMPSNYEFIRIDRVSGLMIYDNVKHKLTARDESNVGLSGEGKVYDFICEPKNKTVF